MNSTVQTLASLQSECIKSSAAYFESIYHDVYSSKLNEITSEDKANFGPFSEMAPPIIMMVIEDLIRKEKCSYEYLKVLLPKEAVTLTCDEDKDYSPFNQETLKLIRERCPGFKTLHLHKDFTMEGVEETTNFNKLLQESLSKLSKLEDISLYDCYLELETFNFISRCCSNLQELNLRHTNITNDGLAFLYGGNSVIKESLRKLIIDDTYISDQSIERCFIHFKKLNYFVSDRTLLATRNLFQRCRSEKRSENDPKFYTTIIKNKFTLNDVLFLNFEFQEWVTERFPVVDHLILTLINESHTSFVNRVITSWKNIVHLELSSVFRSGLYSFDLLKESFGFCAINGKLKSLKLESFVNVELTFLGRIFKKLEKLTLINNTYVGEGQNGLFENLLQVEIILTKYDLSNSIAQDIFSEHMPHDSLYSVLTAKKLEKVYIHNQWNFVNNYLKNLVRGNHLKNLKELKVFCCPIKIDCIKELFLQNIPIKNIVIGLCPLIRVNDVDTLLSDNNYKASITVASQVPYCLRWTILNDPNTI